MITRILKGIDKTFKQVLKLTGGINRILEKLGNKTGEEITKRFIRDNKQKPPSKDFINPKLESMEHSQGVSGYSGSGYKGPGKPHHDKILSNRARHDFTR